MLETRLSHKKTQPPKFRKAALRMFFGMLVKGIEPPAYALRVRCSTPELHQLKAFFLSNKKYYTTFSQKRNLFSQHPGFNSPAACVQRIAACCGL